MEFARGNVAALARTSIRIVRNKFNLVHTTWILTHIAGYRPITVKIFIFSMFFQSMFRGGYSTNSYNSPISASFGL